MKKIRITDARSLFITAMSFFSAEQTLCGALNVEISKQISLRKKQNPLPKFLLPQAVIQAFTMELLLKCLLTIENGEFPSLHNLGTLFEHLPDPIQSELEQRYQAHEKQSPFSKFRGLPGGPPAITTLGDLLKAGGDNFVFLRYTFEGNPPPKGFRAGFTAACLAAKDAILERNPEWKEVC